MRHAQIEKLRALKKRMERRWCVAAPVEAEIVSAELGELIDILLMGRPDAQEFHND